MPTLTKAQLKLLESLNLTTEDVEKAQAKAARETQRDSVAAVFDKHADNLAAFIADLAEVSPIKASSSEGSSWVGTSGAATINGLGVKVVVTDKAASDARKAEQTAAR